MYSHLDISGGIHMNENLSLFDKSLDDTHEESASYVGAFKNLYYHLYSNSDASRAERIFEDTGKLLLVRALVDRSKKGDLLAKFLDGAAGANDTLLPLLAERVPQMISEIDVFTIGDEALRLGLRELMPLNLAKAPASILGEAFQAIIGPRFRGDKGQFFTPRSLVRAMVAVAAPKAKDKVVDPAAGTGSFLVESHVYRKEKYPQVEDFAPLLGLEKDRDLYRLGGAMVNIATDGLGVVHQANSLDLEGLRKLPSPSPFDADIVLTNPPFGAKIGITDTRILSDFALGHSWGFSATKKHWYQLSELRKSQDPQILFLDLCMQLLKPEGLLGIILPEGVFGNRKSGYIWDYVRQNGEIEAMIDCPRTTFQPSTDTKTNVVFIRKRQRKTLSVSNALVAVAKTCGHDRRGRRLTASGNPVQDDYQEIGKAFERKAPNWWSSCEITDPYYLVPRFYHNGAKKAVENMATEWGSETLTLGKLVRDRSIVVRKGHEVSAEAYGTGDIPFVRTSDISNWEISMNPTNGVSEEVYERYRRLQDLKPYDILVVVDGRYRIGRTAILQPQSIKCVVQSHFRIISVAESSPIDCYELLYLFNMPTVLDEMRNLVFIQSTLGAIGKRLEMLQLPVPQRTSEWVAKIKDFREAIEARARLLTKLKEFETPEFEL